MHFCMCNFFFRLSNPMKIFRFGKQQAYANSTLVLSNLVVELGICPTRLLPKFCSCSLWLQMLKKASIILQTIAVRGGCVCWSKWQCCAMEVAHFGCAGPKSNCQRRPWYCGKLSKVAVDSLESRLTLKCNCLCIQTIDLVTPFLFATICHT